MKNILIPTDFSEDSLNAINYSLKLFKGADVAFYLLHVNDMGGHAMDGNMYPPSSRALMEDLMALSKTRILALIKKLEPLSSQNHTFIPLNDYGFFVECIRKHVTEKKIELIVMGTKGASGVLGSIIGSNTGNVITKVKCNTLAVPSLSTFACLKEIAFPTDYSIFYSSGILGALSQLMELGGTKLRVMHASKGEQPLTKAQHQNKEYLQDYLNENFGDNCSFHTITNKKVTTAVQCFVESRNIDLIVMVAKNLNFLQQLLFNSKVEEVSFHTKVPFMVVHDQ
ncbi:MAG: universal stress protein [Sediminicola sp.]